MSEVYCKCDKYQRHELICYGLEFYSRLIGEWHNEFDLLKASERDPSSLELVLSDMDPIKKATALEKASWTGDGGHREGIDRQSACPQTDLGVLEDSS